jgi:hypothetical protein
MIENKIFGVYVDLNNRSRRFVIHRKKLDPLRDVYEVYKPRTLHDFVAKLLIILDKVHPNFMMQLTEQDENLFQSNRTKRRFIAENHNDLSQYN